ncbi:MAG TPA: monofunctional biosynthetic peptidoglycan transglycosylase [Vicinamibacterales bacterium]|nr:monofunctional biosynthetic peptidoglycan transglycosylase [Vicinamibacterales bacterium]
MAARGGFFRRLFRYSLGAICVLLATFAYCWLTLPDVRPLRTQNPTSTAFMRMRSAQAIAEGKSPAYQQRFVRYNRISPNLVRAVLLAEDAGFWGHGGVDWAEIKVSLQRNIDQGELLRGASTITQQLAKNLYLSPSRNPYRKLTEWMIARRLEAELPKQRILELYLNLIEWGDGIWGCEAAALRYFGISCSQLSVEQSALLAGAIINPRIYSPARPNGRLLRRQQIILGKMAATGGGG